MRKGIRYNVTQVNEEIDLEWVELIQEAINIGISIEEVQEFFLKNR